MMVDDHLVFSSRPVMRWPSLGKMICVLTAAGGLWAIAIAAAVFLARAS